MNKKDKTPIVEFKDFRVIFTNNTKEYCLHPLLPVLAIAVLACLLIWFGS